MPTPRTAFKPFVPPSANLPELSIRALLLGAVFGVLFGAVTVYVGLRAGLTVAASIPISVLSISILRAFGKSSILENNIVQTTGNAGQSIASGVIFTLPALVFLGFDLESTRIFALALFGGWLGVLFMIPLRRQLIVEEHETLLYPEGTACADVLEAGERGGSFASRIFAGLGLGAVYTLFQNENLFSLFPATPNYAPDLGPQHLLRGAAIRTDVTPEYLGVGYIIGIRTSAIMLAGGAFSWLVLMPAISFFGGHLTTPLYPGTIPIAQMSPSQLWSTYVRPMGAGAVAAAGLITLLRTLPTIAAALLPALQNLRKPNPAPFAQPHKPGAPGLAPETWDPTNAPTGHPREASARAASTEAIARPARTAHDLPPTVLFGGSALLIALLWIFLQFHPVPGAQVGALANLAAAGLVVLFGFLFVTVSARIVGIVGSSASPVSGMTIATLMATSAIFLVRGWTAPAFGALAITIGGIVCIAASNAGDTAQDLKTGYLLGATPWKQQLALMIGVVVSLFSIGATLNAMNRGLESFQPLPHPIPLNLNQLPDGVRSSGHFTRDHILLTLPPNQTISAGAAPASRAVAVPWNYVYYGTIIPAQSAGKASASQPQTPSTPLPTTTPNSVNTPGNHAVANLTPTNPDNKVELPNTSAYLLLNAIGSATLEDGKYLYNPATGAIEVQWIQGIGSEKAAAPQGRLMATVINGILTRKLPWSLVLLGVALVLAVELLGIRSLTFAVGAYLSIATTLAIFTGGLIRWLVDRALLHHAARHRSATQAAFQQRWQDTYTRWLATNPTSQAASRPREPGAPGLASETWDPTTLPIHPREAGAPSMTASSSWVGSSGDIPGQPPKPGAPGLASETWVPTPHPIQTFLTAHPELTPFPGFNPTNPDHLDPATNLPIPTDVTPSLDLESEISPGSLYASGLIAAGGIVGLLGVLIKLYESATDQTLPRFPLTNPLHHDSVSVLAFAALAFSLYYFARKPLNSDNL